MTRTGRRSAPRTTLVALAATSVLGLAVLAGCASASDEGSGDAATEATTPVGSPTETAGGINGTSTASASPSDSGGVSVDVTFSGDTVSPNGERIDVPAGEDVTLHVTADTAGEIHVHSTPEQELEYDAGTTTLTIKDLDQPGIVEVESHALDKVILQLQVQ